MNMAGQGSWPAFFCKSLEGKIHVIGNKGISLFPNFSRYKNCGKGDIPLFLEINVSTY